MTRYYAEPLRITRYAQNSINSRGAKVTLRCDNRIARLIMTYDYSIGHYSLEKNT